MNITVASEHDLRIVDKDDVNDAIGACFDTHRLLLTEDDVGPSFFRLESGLAGELLQKLVNYRVKSAFVSPDPSTHGQRFAELALEHSTHPHVRFFRDRQDAIDWLCTGGGSSA